MPREAIKNEVPDEWKRRYKAGLCPVCGKTSDEFKKYMKVFCSPKCREKYAEKFEFWVVIREKVFDRDGRICAECHITNDKCREEHQNQRKKKLDGWIKENQDRIEVERNKQLVRLSEYFECEYEKIMDDYACADWALPYDEKRELYKGVRLENPDFEIDHITAVCLDGDMWDMNNLRVLCKQCHKKKTKADHKKRKLIDGQSNLNGEVIK